MRAYQEECDPGSLSDLDIYRRWLFGSLATYPAPAVAAQIQLVVDGYDVVDRKEYPTRERLLPSHPDRYDAVMLTGSSELEHYFAEAPGHTAHDSTNPFIPPLIQYIRDIATAPDYLHLKIIGVCFGHQIISLAMGGQCVAGAGWEVGVYGCDLTEEGQYWWCGDVVGQGGDQRVVSSSAPH